MPKSSQMRSTANVWLSETGLYESEAKRRISETFASSQLAKEVRSTRHTTTESVCCER